MYTFVIYSNFQLPVPVMRDNYPDDKYLYEIIVETGPNDNHATTSTINFILSGNECDTEVRFVVYLFIYSTGCLILKLYRQL